MKVEKSIEGLIRRMSTKWESQKHNLQTINVNWTVVILCKNPKYTYKVATL